MSCTYLIFYKTDLKLINTKKAIYFNEYILFIINC